ncbi:MAG: hypothetical protein P8X42_00885 [Calditrichaceae bacterium]
MAIIIITFLCFSNTKIFLYAQDSVRVEDDSTLAPAQSLIFIPADWDKVTANSIETETADLFTETAYKLNDMEVVDWLYADDVIMEESIDVKDSINAPFALYIGEYGRIDHVYLYRIKSFVQEGRPDQPDGRSFPKKLSDFFINLFDSENPQNSGPYAKNIHTEILVQIDLIDTRLAEIIETFSLYAEHTGGRKVISQHETMNLLSRRLLDALKRIYYTSARISEIGKRIILKDIRNGGTVKKGDKLEILLPDALEIIKNTEIFIPGKPAAYCKIEQINDDNITASLLRQWAPIDTGLLAVESGNKKYGFSIDFLPPVRDRYLALNARLYYSPIYTIDWGAVFRVQKAEDTANHHNWGIGFGLFGSYRIINVSRFALKGRLDADLDMFFRKDDNNKSVSLATGSISPNFTAEFLFSKNTDIIISAGYRFSGESDNWQVNTDDNETDIDAYWNDSAPKMDLSGPFISVGFRFLFY